MSDLSFRLPRARVNLVEALARPAGFMPDSRFGNSGSRHMEAGVAQDDAAEPARPASDPIADAFNDGFVAGHQQAQSEAAAQAEADATAREGLTLAFARLDARLEEELRLRLRETVAALCEAALAPLAIDEDALMRRIERAVAMLARADDEKVIHLHPQDIALISPRLSEDWDVQPDNRVERGTVRVESLHGGVEDGPATWRLAIAEALHQC